MNKLLLFFVMLFFALGGNTWLTDYDEAMKQAKNGNKYVLLNFSGSDWCAGCIRMKRTIFDDAAFENYAKDNLILLNADFPRRKKNRISKEQKAQNEKLIEKFNPQGVFPFTVLLDENGKTVATWKGLPKMTPAEFVADVRSKMSTGAIPVQSFRREGLLMGSRFSIKITGDNEAQAKLALDEAWQEIGRIENTISSWQHESETAQVNKNAGVRPVKVSQELLTMVERSKVISEITRGAFDITFGGLDTTIWHFTTTTKAWPDSTTALAATAHIDYKKVLVDKNNGTIFLSDPKMRIGLGGLGKGYAAEQAKKLLLEKGFKNGIVNAGGDLVLWGKQPNGQPWEIGIQNPDLSTEIFSRISLKDCAIATSGNYEKFFMHEGVRYSHIVDPRTGFPAHGLKSVTVIAPNGEMADAFATALFVMGKEQALVLCKKLKYIDCVLIDDNDQLWTSARVQVQTAQN